jgi:hypothetical protein
MCGVTGRGVWVSARACEGVRPGAWDTGGKDTHSTQNQQVGAAPAIRAENRQFVWVEALVQLCSSRTKQWEAATPDGHNRHSHALNSRVRVKPTTEKESDMIGSMQTKGGCRQGGDTGEGRGKG